MFAIKYSATLYFIFYSTLVSNAKGNTIGNTYSKVKQIRPLEPFVIQSSTLPFSGTIAKFRGHHLTSTTSKGLNENF